MNLLLRLGTWVMWWVPSAALHQLHLIWLLMGRAHLVWCHLCLLQLVTTIVHALLGRHHLHHVGWMDSASVLWVRWAHHLCRILVNRFDFEDIVRIVRLLGLIETSLRNTARSWLSWPMRIEIFGEIIHSALLHHSFQ